MIRKGFVFAVVVSSVLSVGQVQGALVINEILSRPGTGYPENTGLEFVEIYNPDAAVVDLSGWGLTKGVDYVFPAGTTLAAGGYLVVGANPVALQAAAGISGVFGPWEPGDTLADNGEEVVLSKPDGAGGWTRVDGLDYADEGDFAVRTRDSLGGWSWVSGAGTGGRSLERRNPLFAKNTGQNWGDSGGAGGTPGRVNSVFTSNVAPSITGVRHSPAVPTSSDPVTISCHVNDEAAASSISATLYWRNATTTAVGAFQTVAMAGNGSGSFAATLPALADKQIVEFYVSATDGTLTRTWPAPTSEGQNANAAYQVDNEVIAGTAPAYRLVLTAAENAAFTTVASSSNRQFNLTLVVTRGEDTTIRYRSSMRIRGFSSRNYTFKPLRIYIPSDDRWDGVREFNLNPKYPWVQHIAMKFTQAAGLPAADTTPVELRRNGVESTVGSASAQDHGQWARVEPLSSDFVDRHWPGAADVQVYRKENSTYWSSAGSAPTNPDGVYSGWTKKNHQPANDWSDVMNFSTLWQNTAAPHFTGATAGNVQSGTWNNVPFTDAEITTLSSVADFDHMARWFAVMTILNNGEPNIANGGREDADYAGSFVFDGTHRRLQLLPYDIDASLGQGEEARTATAGNLYPMTTPATGGGGPGGGSTTGFEPLLPLFGNATTAGNAAFRAKYLDSIRMYYGSIFDADTTTNAYPPAHAFLDNHLATWVPATVRATMKSYMTQRQTYLLGLIGAGKITSSPTANATWTSTPPGVLRLNEVLASNLTAHANGSTFPDLIELYNSGAVAIDLAGYSLTDDPAVAAKFVFPAGTTIGAGGFLLVYADAATSAPGLHTGFGMSENGDSLLLYDSASNGGALLDSIPFGPQAADVSIGRTSTAPDVWALAVPTPGTANGAAVSLGPLSGVRINEWSGRRDFRLSQDFLELFNPSTQPVALGGVKVTDRQGSSPSRFEFPALSFIGAGGFVVLKRDDLGFGLNGSFDTILLLGANGDWIDQTDFTSQFTDQSTGRSVDGGSTWASFAQPTPGLPNTTALSAANLALLNSLRITELMYQPTGGSTYEFVELQNIGTGALELGGVRFTEGINYAFAAGTTLAPGALIVVAKDRAAFLGRYPGAVSVLADGAFTGSLDNSGETLTLTLPQPRDLNILSFRFEPGWYPATAGGGYSVVAVEQAETPAGDWDEALAWSASPQVNGTPGSAGTPVITSSLIITGVIGEVFNHRITATKAPTSFSATGLPDGLTINQATGLISGTPGVAGTSSIGLTVTNAGGLTTATLVITLATSGPLDHFVWDVVPSVASAGIPFAAKLTARDSANRLVASYTGTLALSASSGGVLSGPPVVITEATDAAEDQFELQNITSSAADTAGWSVRIGQGLTDVSEMSASSFALPASVAGGGVLRVSETNAADRSFFGAPIDWSSTAGVGSRGWIMLLDATNSLRDFFAFGWSEADLANLSVSVNGTVIGPVVLGQWQGAGVAATAANDNWTRVGAGDTNGATDFVLSTTGTFGATNPGITLPWISSTPVVITPAAAVMVNGEWAGFITAATEAANVTLLASGSGRSIASSVFDINAFQGPSDTDQDGLPDSWETGHSLDPNNPADAAADLDGDGQNNLAEFLADTDPRSAASALAITAVTLGDDGTVTLTFTAVGGRRYQLRTTEDLKSWVDSGPPAAAESTGPKSLTLIPTAGQQYVRVEVAP